jgi:hypothetical protein
MIMNINLISDHDKCIGQKFSCTGFISHFVQTHCNWPKWFSVCKIQCEYCTVFLQVIGFLMPTNSWHNLVSFLHFHECRISESWSICQNAYQRHQNPQWWSTERLSTYKHEGRNVGRMLYENLYKAYNNSQFNCLLYGPTSSLKTTVDFRWTMRYIPYSRTFNNHCCVDRNSYMPLLFNSALENAMPLGRWTQTWKGLNWIGHIDVWFMSMTLTYWGWHTYNKKRHQSSTVTGKEAGLEVTRSHDKITLSQPTDPLKM